MMVAVTIGPRSRAALNCADESATAFKSDRRGTRFGTVACQAGIAIADTTPPRQREHVDPRDRHVPRVVEIRERDRLDHQEYLGPQQESATIGMVHE